MHLQRPACLQQAPCLHCLPATPCRRWRSASSQQRQSLARRAAPNPAILCQAGKGFGSGAAAGSKARPKKQKRDASWIKVMETKDYPSGRQAKAVILKDKSAVVIYRPPREDVADSEWFCSDAESTAYRYPLADARVHKRNADWAIECKLDGTVYALRTGKVLQWCPQDNLLRKFLGAIKSTQTPVDLKVYPTIEENGAIYCKFAPSV